MDAFLHEISLQDCPLFIEGGWAFSVLCGDCGCHTAPAEFKSPEEREKAAAAAALCWNMGKVVNPGPGD